MLRSRTALADCDPEAVYGCNLDGEIVDNLLYAARKVRCRLALYFKGRWVSFMNASLHSL